MQFFKYVSLHPAQEVNFKTIKGIFFHMLSWLKENPIYQRNGNYHFERTDEKVTAEEYCEVENY